MITLLSFPPAFALPSASPFCVKVMLLLMWSGQDWCVKFLSDPRKMPHARLPVLKTEQGLIADSHRIEDYLTKKGADFYPTLSDKDQADARAYIRMAEDWLRQARVYDRWIAPQNWPIVRDTFFADIPKPMRGFITSMIRSKTRKGLIAHGVGQMNERERLSAIEPDLGAIISKLKGQTYLFGDRPCGADAAVAPVLAMIANMPKPTLLSEHIRGDDRIMSYIKAMSETEFQNKALQNILANPQ